MGRAKMGDMPEGPKGAGRKYSRKPKFCVRAPRPSKRRPNGVYDILGVKIGCTDDQIRKAFRSRSLELHPDKCSHQQKTAATKRFQELVNARDVLLSKRDRAAYDTQHFPLTSSIRVREHRRSLTSKEKRIVSAMDVCRRRVKAKKAQSGHPVAKQPPELKQCRRRIGTRTPTAKSKIFNVNSKLAVYKRSRREKALDRRKSSYVVEVL